MSVMTNIKGFITKAGYPEPLKLKPLVEIKDPAETYVCHCEDIKLDTVLQVLGDRKTISVDELKHITRLGMGPCRGKRCIPRARQILRSMELNWLEMPHLVPHSPIR